MCIPIGMEQGGRKSGAPQEKRQRSYVKLIPEGYKKGMYPAGLFRFPWKDLG